MKNLWNPKEAAKAKDKLDLLVYSSRLIGSEPDLCVWGGGNTSTKTVEKDFRGKVRRVLRVKGSGSDLKTSVRRDFPAVYMDDLLDLLNTDEMTDEEMVDYVTQCMLDPKAPRPSVEVLLHTFVDQPDIHHTHADAILSLTNTQHGRENVRKVFSKELLWVPYVKPGFTLAKWVSRAYRSNPNTKGVILEKHGIITWGPDAKTSYGRMIEMVTRAEKFLARARAKKKHWSPQIWKTQNASARKEWLLKYLPVIRKTVSRHQKTVLVHLETPDVMEFVNGKVAPAVSQIGPATPDHMLRTKRLPVFIRIPGKGIESLTEKSLVSQLEKYAKDHAAYYARNKRMLGPNPLPMLDPYPKVILIPGIGMIATGKDIKTASVVAEIYQHCISVATNASVIDRFSSLSEKQAFEMDYWPLELYKLSLAPPEAEFSRLVGLVTGAARGIGKAIAVRLAHGGANVFLSDLDFESVKQAAADINQNLKGQRVFPIKMDVTNPASVKSAFEHILLTAGGIDFLVSNAGFAHVSSIDKLETADWDKSLAVNATGHFLVAREAVRILRKQGFGGSLIFIASKNVLAPGKDFGAYSAAKAAESQLARILAIENGDAGVRVNIVNPDGVFQDSGLWDKIRKNRAKTYGIAGAQLEDYYRQRNLMKIRILPEDVAESVAFLVSKRSSKTTGCILTVDGGVKEAFPR